MTTAIKNRRRQRRHSTVGVDAWVEFTTGGQKQLLPIVNLSASGMSFAIGPQHHVPGLEEGMAIDGIELRVADCRMRGDILVMHVTTGTDSRYVCGALFYPATDTDLLKFRSLIVGMEVAGAD